MTRAVLYARYSSDNQKAASIADQFRLCREHAEREGWTVTATYHDAAISGASVTLRPGVQALLQDAQAGCFDVVLAEALDRVSRDQADVATLFKHLRFAGVEIVTLSEGEISELHVGLKGTMNALFLKDLAAKTHRGLRGRVEQGKSGGGLCYGYDVVKDADSAGDPIRGGRRINKAQAKVIRRVFRDFAAGVSPRTLARRLNAESIPGPAGKLWIDTTLRGHARRGTGIINNELYIGRLVWNRLRYMKDPATGKRVSRLNPPERWIVKEVPELRIIDDALWQAVKERQAELAITYAPAIKAGHAERLNRTHRPRALLAGLIFCGCCGGRYVMRGQGRYACSTHVMNASCQNSRSIARKVLEERVLAGLRDRLMAPEVAARAMRAYVEETNRLKRERRATAGADRRALSEIDRKLKEIVAVIEDGGYTRALMERLHKLEAEQDALRARLDSAIADVPDIHPGFAGIYRGKVERLAEALQSPQERDEATQAIRDIVGRITLTPGPKRGQIDATLHGDLGTILDWAAQSREKMGENRAQKHQTDTPFSGVSVSVVAGERYQRYLRELFCSVT
ncbi:recombinase family protein [Pelagibius litoralis]|uniref:Recombinase family protein n=1 Tax=Pelagibius litoralis TaxID=374515 RepID=A0A967F2X5_9PROT|nr:recombinase family protein [Pelagibius litoralis]NIA72037.1 recombinase family protein [Pelagibius litoralis]